MDLNVITVGVKCSQPEWVRRILTTVAIGLAWEACWPAANDPLAVVRRGSALILVFFLLCGCSVQVLAFWWRR